MYTWIFSRGNHHFGWRKIWIHGILEGQTAKCCDAIAGHELLMNNACDAMAIGCEVKVQLF
jgi:hypothetical protein